VLNVRSLREKELEGLYAKTPGISRGKGKTVMSSEFIVVSKRKISEQTEEV